MEVGLSSCHQPVYSAGCTANTSNVKTGSIFPERASEQQSNLSMSSCDISLLLVSEQPAGLRRLRVEQVESVRVTFTETER